jgi:RNA polymerase sigma factor (sigma-70 family)
VVRCAGIHSPYVLRRNRAPMTSLADYWFAFAADDGGDEATVRQRLSERPHGHRDEREDAKDDSGTRFDAAWVARVRTGDADAFDQLVAFYFPRLVRFAGGFTRSRDTADDVAQTVLARVWHRRTNWNPAGTVSAYLFRAVRNVALNEQARRNTMHRTQADAAFALTPSPGPLPDERLERESQRRALQDALETMTERRRTALRLRFEEGMPYANIAEVIGISEKAAQELVSRAIGTLRARLQHLR